MYAKALPKDTTGRNATIAALLWVLTYFGARLLLDADSEPILARGSALSIVAALAPIPPFAAMLWFLGRGIAGTDELERKIHLEALAFAFPLSVLLLMVLGLLDLAIDLNPADWSYRHLWPIMAMFWFLGQALARRRYT
jgi:hypothetical protein